MLIRPRMLRAAVTILGLCTLLACARGVSAQEPAAPGASAAQLIEKLGLHVASQPVRERPGWRPPRIILVSEQLHDQLRVTQHQVDYLGRYGNNLGPADLHTNGPYGLYSTVGVRWSFGGYGHQNAPY